MAALDCGWMREDGVGRMLMRPVVLEKGGGGVELGGVRVRMDEDEERLVSRGTAAKHNKRIGKVLINLHEWGSGAEGDCVIVAVDGSARGKGKDKRVAYGLYYGLGPAQVPQHRAAWGETSRDMAECMRLAGSCGRGAAAGPV